MNTRQLKYFLAVAELESLTAAAQRLNVSQPALGQQIRNLEERVGLQLVERHSRGVSLTEAGKRLKAHSQDILERINLAEADLRRYARTPTGAVSLGVTPSLGRALVPRLLERCSDQFPEMRLQFTQGFTDQLEHLLDDGVVDMAVTHSKRDNMRHETVALYEESIQLIGKPQFISGLPDPVSVRDLASIPLMIDERNQQVRKIIDAALQAAGTKLTDTIEIQAINIRREFVMQGKRCSFAPRALFADEVEAGLLLARHVAAPEFSRVIHLGTPRVEILTPAMAAMRALTVELIDEEIRSGRFGWLSPENSSQKKIQ